MKICPFMSHMLGAEGNVLEIDSPAPRAAGEIVELGYDEESAVGVKTERKSARASKAKSHASSTASHLYCLRDTCRFYRAKDGDCSFDAILENVSQQSRALSDLSHKGDKDKKDESAVTISRELDKFWKFQTKSVTELISSFGESEKRQGESFTKLVSDVEKRIISFMDEDDTRDERLNVIRDGVLEIKDTIDARNDGFDSLTTTVSDLVLSFEDNLKELKTQSQALAKRLEGLEGISGKMKALDGVSSKLDKLDRLDNLDKLDKLDKLSKIDGMVTGIDALKDATSQLGKLDKLDDLNKLDGVVSKIDALKNVGSRIDAVDANVSRTIDNLDRLERNWAELMDVVKSSKKKSDEPGAQNRRREAMKFNNLGVTSFHNGDLSLARDQFLEAVNRDDTFAECFNNLGLVYTELGEANLAADAFSKAIKLNPELHAAYNNLGYVFYKQANYDRAIEMYNEALARSANNSSAYTNLGNAYFKLGDRKEARKAWEKAIEIDPANETAQRSLKNMG
jgi:tetratricopeptide (TPR) repeat protein